MGQTLTAVAKQAARLLIVELLVPGGTLLVLSILLAKGKFPVLSERIPALVHSHVAHQPSGLGNDLVAYYGLRRMP